MPLLRFDDADVILLVGVRDRGCMTAVGVRRRELAGIGQLQEGDELLAAASRVREQAPGS